MKSFQTIVLAIFIFFIVVALLMFAFFQSSGTSGVQIKLWGTLSAEAFGQYLQKMTDTAGLKINVAYTAKDPDTFDANLIENLASGTGPDAIILTNDLLLRYANKIYPIPLATLSSRDFTDTYADGASIFMTGAGTLAIPLTVDPLVMYWNRDILSDAGKTRPPVYWDEFQTFAQDVTKKTATQILTRSAVAFGEYRNVNNAKNILSALFLQAGASVVKNTESGLAGGLVVDGVGESPASSVLRFYTEFADPTKVIYSWNRALPSAKNYFLGGDLALYFGLSSEYRDLRNKNPNLSLDVAMLPQIRNAKNRLDVGPMLGLAIMRTSPNVAAAFTNLTTMASAESVKIWTEIFGGVPLRRDLLSLMPADAINNIFYRSALITRNWVDPDNVKTATIFQNLVENVVTGKTGIEDAVSRANDELNLFFINKN